MGARPPPGLAGENTALHDWPWGGTCLLGEGTVRAGQRGQWSKRPLAKLDSGQGTHGPRAPGEGPVRPAEGVSQHVSVRRARTPLGAALSPAAPLKGQPGGSGGLGSFAPELQEVCSPHVPGKKITLNRWDQDASPGPQWPLSSRRSSCPDGLRLRQGRAQLLGEVSGMNPQTAVRTSIRGGKTPLSRGAVWTPRACLSASEPRAGVGSGRGWGFLSEQIGRWEEAAGLSPEKSRRPALAAAGSEKPRRGFWGVRQRGLWAGHPHPRGTWHRLVRAPSTLQGTGGHSSRAGSVLSGPAGRPGRQRTQTRAALSAAHGADAAVARGPLACPHRRCGWGTRCWPRSRPSGNPVISN